MGFAGGFSSFRFGTCCGEGEERLRVLLLLLLTGALDACVGVHALSAAASSMSLGGLGGERIGVGVGLDVVEGLRRKETRL
mgnify:CR=1 FL=1